MAYVANVHTSTKVAFLHFFSKLSWNVKATFPTGPTRELRWHDGIVIDVQALTGTGYKYQFYFEIDGEDEWINGSELPVKSVCFRKAHLPEPRAIEDAMEKAKGKLAAREMRGSESEQPVTPRAAAGAAAAMRARADFNA